MILSPFSACMLTTDLVNVSTWSPLPRISVHFLQILVILTSAQLHKTILITQLTNNWSAPCTDKHIDEILMMRSGNVRFPPKTDVTLIWFKSTSDYLANHCWFFFSMGNTGDRDFLDTYKVNNFLYCHFSMIILNIQCWKWQKQTCLWVLF